MGRQNSTQVSREFLSGPCRAGHNWPDAVWGLVDFPKKVQLLGPHLADVGGEFGCSGGCVDIGRDTVTNSPVGQVGHLNCLVLVNFLIDLLVLQVLIPLSQVVLSVHDYQAASFVSLPDSQVPVGFELGDCLSDIPRYVGIKVQGLKGCQSVFHQVQSAVGSLFPDCPVTLLNAQVHLSLKLSKNSKGEGTSVGVGANLRPSSKAFVWELERMWLDRLSTGLEILVMVVGFVSMVVVVVGSSVMVGRGDEAACGGGLSSCSWLMESAAVVELLWPAGVVVEGEETTAT